MTPITIVRYSKPRCPSCVLMDETLTRWQKGKSRPVYVEDKSALDYLEYLRGEGHMAAPVYEITIDGVTRSVSGAQPDVLVDILDGTSGIWDFDDDL